MFSECMLRKVSHAGNRHRRPHLTKDTKWDGVIMITMPQVRVSPYIECRLLKAHKMARSILDRKPTARVHVHRYRARKRGAVLGPGVLIE